ncbi:MULTISPECIES: DUF309 domain-containing protein [unclassified Paenibacillus]|uniref:DUF309 domain-containing protein n=1 Tax=unclassified Paenibacillus TaxID=185978 RepID=UPI00104FB53E|nr:MULTISPECIES: DUF309 domain-containing protein [unclassified Paenibacillus]NIK67857.1 hypothetical protein [Paenibacillus sp. BK720]TCN01898.1 hypothetical protein EV294_1011359 [Paenibacillus sp. BK033]
MNYPSAYISYLAEFNGTRDFFECHELLEEHWKEHPDDPRALLWVGLIQLAVGQYHERRGNSNGALKMYEKALGKLDLLSLEQLGLDGTRTIEDLSRRYDCLRKGQSLPYRDMTLVVTDPELERHCIQLCDALQVKWGSSSPMNADALIHRHKLRDRSDVLAERAAAIEAKKRNRTAE